VPRRAPASRDLVFLNVPFDSEYEPLFLALIAGLVRLGLRPRSVLEIPTQKDRVKRLLGLIRSCGSSIHELSRIELSNGRPRFNMPFEAGLAVAWAEVAEKTHRWFLFEKEPYRLQQTLSDLNGFEVFIHGGKVRGLLATLPNMFRPKIETPSVRELLACARALQSAARGLKRDIQSSDVYGAATFRKLVVMATEIAELSRAGKLSQEQGLTLDVTFDSEKDGRRIASIDAIPGCIVYGNTRAQALAKVQALALRIIAERLEYGEASPGQANVSFVVSPAW
jgi:predicted RNase H-like HicB family nuclease